MTRITEVKCMRTRSNGSWTVVKVLTDQPCLYGLDRRADGTVVRPQGPTAFVESIIP